MHVFVGLAANFILTDVIRLVVLAIFTTTSPTITDAFSVAITIPAIGILLLKVVILFLKVGITVVGRVIFTCIAASWSCHSAVAHKCASRSIIWESG
jgi:hypothetical protein